MNPVKVESAMTLPFSLPMLYRFNLKFGLNMWKCGLHPLIHTLLKFNLPQDIESINKRSRSSAVLFEK